MFIHDMKPRKKCGCRAVFSPKFEPGRFEFHNGITNHNAPNCNDIYRICSWSLPFVIMLPCYPRCTMSTFLVSFSEQFECAILSSPVRAEYVHSITCHVWKIHVTNTTTFKIFIISVLSVNCT